MLLLTTLLFLMTLFISAVLTGLEIPVLMDKQFGQFIREEGPGSHKAKEGTPTMGGIALYGAVMIGAVITQLIMGCDIKDMMIMITAGLSFGLIGFADDYIKVAKKHNLGLTAVQKLVLQILFAVLYAIYMMLFTGEGSVLFVPVLNKYIDIGIWYVPFIAFVMVAMANSVNLTDGLDGLCAGVTGIIALFFVLVAVKVGSNESFAYLLAMAGACFGFLLWNRNPAKIFMGDTGSMALGAGLTAGVIMMKQELLIPVAGLIFVIEAMSVIIQVLYFKATHGKRFFRMAPIHHHFELGGMSEKNVVKMFWLFAFLCSLVAFLITFV